MIVTPPFKRGDTFAAKCTYLVDGAPAPLPAIVRAQLRDRAGTLVQAFTFALIDASAGQYSLGAAAAETTSWPLGVSLCDIEYTDIDGNVSSTETFGVNVVQDITRD